MQMARAKHRLISLMRAAMVEPRSLASPRLMLSWLHRHRLARQQRRRASCRRPLRKPRLQRRALLRVALAPAQWLVLLALESVEAKTEARPDLR